MAHPYAKSHEDKVSRARVSKILKSGNTSAAHDTTKDIYPGIHPGGSQGSNTKVPGKKKPGRFARGGSVKSPVNIAIVVPKSGESSGAGPAGAGAPPPMPVPAPPMPPPGAGGPPPGMPPGMPPGGPPMRASGGRVGGDASKKNLKGWAKHADGGSYARGGGLPKGGAGTGVGRKQLAHLTERKN